jgi:hypothetical protein
MQAHEVDAGTVRRRGGLRRAGTFHRSSAGVGTTSRHGGPARILTGGPTPRGRMLTGLRINRPTGGNKPLQFVPREQVPQS